MIGRALLVAIAGCALAPGSAVAQMPDWLGRVGVEVRGGLSVGNHSESAAELELAAKPSFDRNWPWDPGFAADSWSVRPGRAPRENLQTSESALNLARVSKGTLAAGRPSRACRTAI